ncbi:hypothetical protein KM043_005707 [Ampulex compressa]|nr:hypothetical protein KM043_005707 [Ampulex compressa]
METYFTGTYERAKEPIGVQGGLARFVSHAELRDERLAMARGLSESAGREGSYEARTPPAPSSRMISSGEHTEAQISEIEFSRFE